jgi:hypothetical protein
MIKALKSLRAEESNARECKQQCIELARKNQTFLSSSTVIGLYSIPYLESDF